jgi:hypothetical protein
VNASVLSMRTNGSGTAAQLIFSDSDFGSTGKLFNLRQAGVDKFVVDANGTFVTAAMPATLVTNTPAGGIAATTAQAAINELDTEKAPLASPTLTGTPAAPTPVPATSTTQVATTAFAHSLYVDVQTQPLYDALFTAGLIDSTVQYLIPLDTAYKARDTFARTVVDGLGSADVGGAWTIIQGPAANFDVDTGMLHVGHPAATSDKSANLSAVDTRDQEVGFAFRGSALITAGSMQVFALMRFTDNSNLYRIRTLIQSGVNMQLDRPEGRDGNADRSCCRGDDVRLPFAASTWYRLRAQTIGGANPVTVRAKLWAEGTVEPAAWNTWTDAASVVDWRDRFGSVYACERRDAVDVHGGLQGLLCPSGDAMTLAGSGRRVMYGGVERSVLVGNATRSGTGGGGWLLRRRWRRCIGVPASTARITWRPAGRGRYGSAVRHDQLELLRG